MDSTLSSVWRIPAVSIKRKVIPCRLIVSSMTSRVVPSISETIARSSRRRAFSKVLFPTFVFPTIATGIPFLSTLPKEKESHKREIKVSIPTAMERSSERSANSTSSSEKSSSNSSNEVTRKSSIRNFINSSEKPPRIWFSAILWAADEDEAIRSATASACDRSILPFKNARCVNSPGVAKRAPEVISNCNRRCWI